MMTAGIKIAGYSLLRAADLGNTKKRGVCSCYKDFLSLTKKDDIFYMKDRHHR